MNPLVRLYLERQIELHDRREIRRLICECREATRAVQPIREKYEELKKTNRRMDGSSGFVMGS